MPALLASTEFPWLVVPGLAAWLVLFLAYAALSLLWTPDPLGGAWLLAHLALLCGLVIVGSRLRDLRRPLVAIGVGVALTAPLVVAQVAGYSPVDQVAAPAGLFLNRNVLAELTAPLLVWAVLRGGPSWLTTPLAVVLGLSMDRAAMVGLVAALWIVLARPWKIVLIVAGGVLLLALTMNSPWGISSAGERFEIWQAALAGLMPWGRGVGSFAALYPVWEFVHCDPLQLLFELGPLGGFPIVVVICRALASGDRAAIGDRASLVCLVAESLFSMPFQLPVTTMLADLLVGRLYAARVVVCWREPIGGVAPAGDVCGGVADSGRNVGGGSSRRGHLPARPASAATG